MLTIRQPEILYELVRSISVLVFENENIQRININFYKEESNYVGPEMIFFA